MNFSITSFGNAPTVTPNTQNAQNTNTSKVDAKQKKAGKSEAGSLRDEFKKQGINIPEPTPLMVGLGNAVFWFGTGFLLDRLMGSISKALKTPTGLSLKINGAIGLLAGVWGYIKAKREE